MLPDIPGELVTERSELAELKQRVCALLDANFSPRRFPGAQPVSFARSHIRDLLEEDYYVSEKADGVRVLLYTLQLKSGAEESYLIDRKNNYYRLRFGLPLPGLRKAHVDTIVDGELVFENRSRSQTPPLLFMLFDALVMNGKLLIQRPYTSRLGHLRESVVIPFQDLARSNPKYRNSLPFQITQKRVETSYHLPLVVEHMQKYKHKTDGVIFTSVSAPYTLGTCPKMLKWKPAYENTVDFQVHDDNGEFHIGILIENNDHKDLGKIYLEDELAEEWKNDSPIGKIIECRYDPTWPNYWRFSRYRTDKLTANHVSVYEKIMKSIEDNVTMEELIEISPLIYDRWKIRDPKLKPHRLKE